MWHQCANMHLHHMAYFHVHLGVYNRVMAMQPFAASMASAAHRMADHAGEAPLKFKHAVRPRPEVSRSTFCSAMHASLPKLCKIAQHTANRSDIKTSTIV